MQWLAALCVRRPVFASVLVLTLAVVGVFGYSQLGVDRFPKVDFPTIMITTRQPGAAPQQVETEISDKIEEAVNTISGLDELRSTSAEGVSIVTASFLLEKNVDTAAQEVRDKVNRILPQLPRTILQPTIEKMDMDAAPVLGIAISAPRPVLEVTEYADKVLRRRLETVNGVGQVLVIGGRGRQINLWLDPDRLHAYNVTVTEVSRALQAQNIEVPGGRLEQGSRNLTLRTRGRVQSVADFGQIIVRIRDGHAITVADIATVEDGMQDAGTLANINGKPTVVLNIRRQSGTNAVQVIQAVKDRLEELRATLPAGYEMKIVRDQGDFIKASIRAVQEHLIVGALLAALVVLIFLGNLRSTIIAAIAIPTSIVAAFGLIWYEGFTLNSMTMLALTLSVGIVIDDAIVVLENIYRFIEEKGQDPFKAAVEATKEIGLAVLATTLSLVAIFLPIGFMGGIVGMFMKSFGLTMAFAVLVSLLVSFTLTPMLGARWLRLRPQDVDPTHPKHTSRESSWFAPLDHGYTRLLEWALGHRRLVALIAFLVFVSSGPLFMVANKNFLPIDDQSEFEISVRAPEGTSLEATELTSNRIAANLRSTLAEVAFTMVTVADDTARTPNSATIYVRLVPISERSRDVFEVSDIIRRTLVQQYAAAGTRTAVRPIAAMGGGGQQDFTPTIQRWRAVGCALAQEFLVPPGDDFFVSKLTPLFDYVHGSEAYMHGYPFPRADAVVYDMLCRDHPGIAAYKAKIDLARFDPETLPVPVLAITNAATPESRAILDRNLSVEADVLNYFRRHAGTRGGNWWLGSRARCTCMVHSVSHALLYLRGCLNEPELFETPCIAGTLVHNQYVAPRYDIRNAFGQSGLRDGQLKPFGGGDATRWVLAALSKNPLEPTIYRIKESLRAIDGPMAADEERAVDRFFDESPNFVLPLLVALGWYNPDAPELNWDDLPPSMVFDAEGEVCMKSGWDTNMTDICFSSGPRDVTYTDAPNSLNIFKAGEMLFGNPRFQGDHGNPVDAHGNCVLAGNRKGWPEWWAAGADWPRMAERSIINRFPRQMRAYVSRDEQLSRVLPFGYQPGMGLLHLHCHSDHP
ncbi:MAG: efflux RND transporter permease subunit, partial [Acidobacteria bacterium]|nr:efflux RND transporter permease subunit [Acidobacteriota bacterium]